MFGPQLKAVFDKGNGPVNLELGIYKDEPDAVCKFVEWLNDNRVRLYLLMQFPPSYTGEQDWFRKLPEDKNEIAWGIYANGNLIGCTSLMSINRSNASAEIGIVIGDKDWWGKGIATVAEMLITEYSFSNVTADGLNKLYARVLAGNEASRKALLNTGFREVGSYRRDVYQCGRWFDVWAADLLREEWKSEREERLRRAGVMEFNVYPGCEDILSELEAASLRAEIVFGKSRLLLKNRLHVADKHIIALIKKSAAPIYARL